MDRNWNLHYFTSGYSIQYDPLNLGLKIEGVNGDLSSLSKENYEIIRHNELNEHQLGIYMLGVKAFLEGEDDCSSLMQCNDLIFWRWGYAQTSHEIIELAQPYMSETESELSYVVGIGLNLMMFNLLDKLDNSRSKINFAVARYLAMAWGQIAAMNEDGKDLDDYRYGLTFNGRFDLSLPSRLINFKNKTLNSEWQRSFIAIKEWLDNEQEEYDRKNNENEIRRNNVDNLTSEWKLNDWVALKFGVLMESSENDSWVTLYILLYDIKSKEIQTLKQTNRGIEIIKHQSIDEHDAFVSKDLPYLGQETPWDYASFSHYPLKDISEYMDGFEPPSSDAIKSVLDNLNPLTDSTGDPKIVIVSAFQPEGEVPYDVVKFRVLNASPEVRKLEETFLDIDDSVNSLKYNPTRQVGQFVCFDHNFSKQSEILIS